ncbi:MAG: CDP-glucose 4,6-dehydratase [Lachnospiraceae bacterium]|nr:CDP-glucose 4,6-dehydratase [Lachnospiraceae bacterium]
MLSLTELKKYFASKRVFVTGHTGFKGSYLCVLLRCLGAKVYGYSLKPQKGDLYDILSRDIKTAKSSKSGILNNKKLVDAEVFADIRNLKKLTHFIKKVKPDYVIHMAAQPLVLKGYEEPHYTYEVNVMGTVNILEAIKNSVDANKKQKPISILNVTTDKVYENNDLSNYAFKENDKLCGRDPYANSKSCSELVTYAYAKSFFADKNLYRISTARAGNVIGGGDLNENRIIPDCYRAIRDKKEMVIRNKKSIRPYQYVLEPLILYLNILAYQLTNKKYEGNYNIGPDKKNCLTTEVLTNKFFKEWEKLEVTDTKIKSDTLDKTAKKHEAKFLRLDNSFIKNKFKYKEIFNIDKTMQFTTKVYYDMKVHNDIYDSIVEIIKTIT